MRILIVEDVQVNRQFLLALLAPLGPCDTAGNGQEAIEAFEAARQQGCPYDLICMDTILPEMTGRDAVAEIRRREMENNILGPKGTKIIMTTALESPLNVAGTFRDGCEAYLSKPVTREKIYQEIFELGLIPQPLADLS